MRIVKCIFYSIIVLCVIPGKIYAQTDNPWNKIPDFYINGYLEVFYAYDFNRPSAVQRQPFFYNHNRHNEFNINHGLIGFGVEHSKYRATLTMQTGTYPNDNYSDEPGVLKNIYEAYIGLSLNRKNNLWFDAGIFESFIGFEGPISIDNWTLSRSLCSENVPYFLTGAKITYTPNDKWTLLGSITNGWQRIQKVQGNSIPSFGTQVLYSPNKKYSLNWSTFIGTDDPDSTRRMRYYNNFYGLFQFTNKLGLIAGFDIGVQQESKTSSSYNNWHTITLILRYEFTEKWAAAFRAENYQDKDNVMIETQAPGRFNTSGISLNGDYRPLPNLACRIEARYLHNGDPVFTKDENPVNSNFFIVASIAYKLNKKLNK